MFKPAVGFLGGAILATSPEFIILSRVVVHDIALAFFMTLALSTFYVAFKFEPHRRAFLLAMYASAGFAVLGKGPIGVFLPALIIGLFLLLKRRLSFLKRMEIGRGILLFLLVSAPWYIMISLRNEDYAGYFFIQQNLMNFISSQEARHSEPFYYYFPVLMGGFFPWSFFLPLALIREVRKALERTSDEALFLLIWFGVIFLFFSAAGSKLGTYILPLYPAASLLVAVFWREVIAEATPGLRRGFFCCIVVLVVVLLSGMAYVLIHPLTDLEGLYGIDTARINYMVFLLAGGGILATLFFATQRLSGSFWTLVGMIVVGILSFVVLIVPLINPYRSTKGLARELDRMIPPGENLVFFHGVKDSALFYTDRRATVLRGQRKLRGYLDSDERVFCVIDRKRLDRMWKLKSKVHVLNQEGRKLLISNRPDS
jgi:4-amino-4-deoxy-L-arabinose transferase-like glycosyltransferase